MAIKGHVQMAASGQIRLTADTIELHVNLIELPELLIVHPDAGERALDVKDLPAGGAATGPAASERPQLIVDTTMVGD